MNAMANLRLSQNQTKDYGINAHAITHAIYSVSLCLILPSTSLMPTLSFKPYIAFVLARKANKRIIWY